MEHYWLIIISLIPIIFFSGIEFAFSSSNKLWFEIDKQAHNILSRIIKLFYRHSNRFTATMTTCYIFSLAIFATYTMTVMSDFIHNEPLAVTAALLTTIIVALIAGKIIPYTIATLNPNMLLYISSPVLYIVYLVFHPITTIAILLSKGILFLFGHRDLSTDDEFDKTDLNDLINETEHEDEIENDVKIFRNALDFSSITLRECAVPRTEIVALPESGTTIEDLKNAFITTGYSKIPVYKESIDNIIGYFHAGDLFNFPSDWHRFLRTMPAVPETMPANKLMDIFMQTKKSIAVVIDEFGGTSGIVTLEDIMEEIFGEIEDEHDNKKFTAKKISDNEYLLSGRIEIDAANSDFGLDLPESDEYMTIAGYILHNYKAFPKLNDTIKIENYTFKIIQAHNNRIDLVRLTINKER